jgi:hypothetical protein
MTTTLRAACLLAATVLATSAACSRNAMLDPAMSSAPHTPPTEGRRVGPYEVLGGDMHCHILPPDSPTHVSREIEETARIAEEEGLDFVVLTPHVPSRFFLDPEKREWVRGTQSVLRARSAAMARKTIFIPGMEYTDHRFGHVGLAFADVAEVLDEIPVADPLATPELFFERWKARGGLVTINHPTLTPLPHAPFDELRSDLSWRDFGPEPPAVVLPEVRWISRNAQSIETHNLSIGHLRDQFFMRDPDWTLRESSYLLDREARAQHRRIAAVGGSDSHGGWLRPTTWVLATERSVAGIRDAILAGRTCVRGPEACSLEVGGTDGALHVVGASISSSSSHAIEARAHGGAATYFVNDAPAASGVDGELVKVPVPGHCSVLRAVVGRSWSGPVYVDCAWAAASAKADVAERGP